MARKDPPVSARTLRRTEKRLTDLMQQHTDMMFGLVQNIHIGTLNLIDRAKAAEQQITAFRSEVGERLRMIELELEALGAVVPTLPRWTKEQREAFEAGDTDRKIGNGVKALAENLMRPV